MKFLDREGRGYPANPDKERPRGPGGRRRAGGRPGGRQTQ